MSDSKHTPGPWRMNKCLCGHPACTQFTISVQGGVGFEAADARVITAAPDMLAALKRILNHPMSRMDDTTERVVRAAIAKAGDRL